MADLVNQELVEKAKLALRLKTDAFDTELDDLISAAKIDLEIAGVTLPAEVDAIVQTAILTYVHVHFGQPEEYERIKRSYDEQKAQLKTATGYAEWDGEA